MAKVYGIDLGTTYSVIATLDEHGMPRVIENEEEGTSTLASAVYFQSGGDPVVGEVAKSQAVIEPDRVVQYVKREIGKSDAQTREFDGIEYDPIIISSIILKRMKEYAEAQGEDEVKDVVITCPAYFGNEERAATKQAGIIAGLNVLNIVNEPTAAAMNYCSRVFHENSKIMVYDLGGGTFDITLFNLSVDDEGKMTIDVIDTGGDDRLGGIDWDDRLYDHIRELYCDENGLASDQINNELRATIKNNVEATKKLLSKKSSHSFVISYEGDTSRIEVSAEKFEELTQDLVERTMSFVNKLLSNNSLTPDNIDVVLLVGGSTKMPMVKKAVEGLFPDKVRNEDPDKAVAKGAALEAAIEWIDDYTKRKTDEEDVFKASNNDKGDREPVAQITEEEEEQAAAIMAMSNLQKIGTVSDKLTRSFGPAVLVDRTKYMIDNLLFIGDESPSEATGNYATVADNQTGVKITVFENVAKDRVDKYVTPPIDKDGNTQPVDPALKVKSLGSVVLELPPGSPEGTPIEVFFRCSAIGLEVRATNVTTGESIETVITSASGATKTQEELDEAVEHMTSVKTSGSI
jgi:molecular chaperone DnaK (HSP70)